MCVGCACISSLEPINHLHNEPCNLCVHAISMQACVCVYVCMLDISHYVNVSRVPAELMGRKATTSSVRCLRCFRHGIYSSRLKSTSLRTASQQEAIDFFLKQIYSTMHSLRRYAVPDGRAGHTRSQKLAQSFSSEVFAERNLFEP